METGKDLIGSDTICAQHGILKPAFDEEFCYMCAKPEASNVLGWPEAHVPCSVMLMLTTKKPMGLIQMVGLLSARYSS